MHKILLLILAVFLVQACEDANDAIDYKYPNNWRSAELTHSSYRMQSGDTPCPIDGADFKYINPIPSIIKYARDHKIVLINESHSKPLHRLFIAEIAKLLSTEGYKHYGSELFSINSTERLNSENGLRIKKFLSSQDLQFPYREDPVFAQVMEELASIGYNFFSYEADASSPPEETLDAVTYRDGLQADNIIMYLAGHDDEKALIHAGYYHIKENDSSSDSVWMAEHLNVKYGQNPLTISQTDCYGTEYFKDGFLGYALLADINGKPVSRNGYDLILVAPKETQYNERPVWLRDHMGRRFVNIPKLAQFDGPDDFTIIKAFKKGDNPEAIPEDLIYRTPFSQKVLALRPGTYRIEVSDRNKSILTKMEVIVK